MYIILHFLLTPIEACLFLILFMSDCVYMFVDTMYILIVIILIFIRKI